MKLYLRLKDAPELSALPPAQRSRVHRLCYQRYAGTAWQVWLANLLLGLAAGMGFYASKFVCQFTDVPVLPTLVGGTLVGGAVGFVIFRQLVISCLRPHYSECLQELASAQAQPKP